jgi:hypothetical protein
VTIDEVLDYYKSRVALARAVRVQTQAIHNWVTAGKVPPLRQVQIEQLTAGALKADADVYEQKRGQVA